MYINKKTVMANASKWRNINNIAALFLMLLVSACAQQTKAPVKLEVENSPFASGSSMIYEGQGMGRSLQATNTSGALSTIMSSSEVQVFPLDGETANPFGGTRTRRSIIENTTSGGYTVLDKNVMVYPLDDNQRPSYLPQFQGPHSNVIQSGYGQNAATVGNPMNSYGAPGSAVGNNQSVMNRSAFNSAADLPALNLPPKLNMPAPTGLRAPTPSPFDEATAMPVPTARDMGVYMPNAPLTAPHSMNTPIVPPSGLTGYQDTPDMMPIGSGLTGYQEKLPSTLSEANQRAQQVQQYKSLAQRAGTSMQDVTLATQEPIAMQQRWAPAGASMPAGAVSMPEMQTFPQAMTAMPAQGYPVAPAAPVPLNGTHSDMMMQMAPVNPYDGSDLPAGQPRRTPPQRNNGMLTGY